MATRGVAESRPARSSSSALRGWLQGWAGASGLSRPELACGILQATAVTVCLVLAIWMLLLISKPGRGLEAWSVAQGVEASMPWVGSPKLDAAALAGRTGGRAEEVEPGGFLARFERLLETARGQSVVVFVSAAGVGDLGIDGGYLPTQRAGRIAGKLQEVLPNSEILARDLIKRCQNYPNLRKLLIWDAGQIGSDRNLGVFGNSFIASLDRALKSEQEKTGPGSLRRANLAVLVSSAPGQTSWWSDHDARSVFAWFVDRGLQGEADTSRLTAPGVTVQKLAAYVRTQVQRWVKEHRGAEQTPLLLSDQPAAAIDFRLPRLPKPQPPAIASGSKSPAPAGTSPAGDDTTRILTRLEKAWDSFEELDRRGLLHRAPAEWLRYEEQLQRAERFFRGGDLFLADELLDRLPTAGQVADPAAAVDAISIAELKLRLGPDAARLKEAEGLLQEAEDELIGREERPESQAEPRPAAEPAKGKDESKEDQDKDAAKAEKDKDAPKRNAAPAGLLPGRGVTARRRPAEEVFKALMRPGDRDRDVPLYLEYQLLAWARAFTHTRLEPVPGFGPDPSAFNGVRGELLRRAIDVRRRAEQAAAADARVLPWTQPLIEAADTDRRLVQDRLFTAAPPPTPPLVERLDALKADYAEAEKVAEEVAQALRLLDRTLATMPAYTQWLLRRGGQPESEPGGRVWTILDQARSLAAGLSQKPGAQPGEIREQLKNITSIREELRQSVDALDQEFQKNLDSARRWRDLDALLCVPLIPAKQRSEILRRIGTPAVAGSLDGGQEAGAVASSGIPGPRPGDDPPPEDTGTRALALGLVQLELKLLALVSQDERRTAQLSLIGERCNEASRANDAMQRGEQLSRIAFQIRELRQDRLRKLNDHLDASLAGLLARDLAIRTLPLADAESLTGGSSDPYAYLRQTWLDWQSRRLLADAAPQHARSVLERARQTAKPPPEIDTAINEGLNRVGQLNGLFAALGLDLPGGSTCRLDERVDQRPLPLVVKGGDTLPEGEASVFVAFDPQKPVSISGESAGQKTDLRTGLLVPLGAGKVSGAPMVQVARSEPTREPLTVPIRPGLFYRGQIKLWDRGAVNVAMSKQGGIEIELRQSDRGLARIHGDQFTRHRNQGFLHPSSRLACKMVITHNYPSPTVVRVRHGFKDKDNARELPVKPITLLPGQPNDEVLFVVSTGRDQLPDDRPREYSVEILAEKDDRKPLYQNTFPFRMLKPEEVIAIESAGFDPATGYFFAIIRHLASDPVCGTVDVSVTFAGTTPGRQAKMPRKAWQDWYIRYAGEPPQKVPVSVSLNNRWNALTQDVLTGPEAPPPAQPPGAAAKPPAL